MVASKCLVRAEISWNENFHGADMLVSCVCLSVCLSPSYSSLFKSSIHKTLYTGGHRSGNKLIKFLKPSASGFGIPDAAISWRILQYRGRVSKKTGKTQDHPPTIVGRAKNLHLMIDPDSCALWLECTMMLRNVL